MPALGARRAKASRYAEKPSNTIERTVRASSEDGGSEHKTSDSIKSSAMAIYFLYWPLQDGNICTSSKSSWRSRRFLKRLGCEFSASSTKGLGERNSGAAVTSPKVLPAPFPSCIQQST